jgi:hypothetical protein
MYTASLSLALLLFPSSGLSGDYDYEEKCKVSAGEITGCYSGAFYGELAVAYNPSSGKYEEKCKVSAGKITGCYGGTHYGDLSVAYSR